MYKAIKKISRCDLTYNLNRNKLYVFFKEKDKLSEIDDLGNEKETITFFNINNIYRFRITNDNFIVSFNNGKTIFYSTKGKELLKLEKQLYFSFIKENDIYIYIKNKNFLYRFDKTKNNLEIFNILEQPLFIRLCNDYLILKKNSNIYIYIDRSSEISFLWEKDLSEITSYTEWDNTEEQGEIREVYVFENSILVLTQVFILRIDIQTGNIIYSLRLPAGLMTLSIQGKKAYGCYGYHYMEIDIEKGKLLNFVRIETVFYKEKEYSAIMNKGTYHNGFVFHGLRLEGGQYAIGAINIMTGKREWVDLLDVFMIENIQFHQDKMFVSDTGSNLFIYESL